MISIFKKNLFFNSLLLLPYVAIVRIHTLIYPKAYVATEADPLLTQWIFDGLSNPFIQSILGVVLVFLQANLINRLVIKNKIARQLTLLPGMIYALLVSFLPSFSAFSPALLANTFLIWAVYESFAIYKKHYTGLRLFNAGFGIGLATLLVPSMWMFFIFGFLVTQTLHSINLRRILQLLVGIGMSFYLAYAVYHMLDYDFLKELSLFRVQFNTVVFVNFVAHLKELVFIVVSFIVVLFGYNSYHKKKPIDAQKKIDLMYWLMVCTFFVVVFGFTPSFSFLVFYTVGVSVLLHMNVVSFKNVFLAEVLHIALLALSLSIHFGLL